MSIVFCIVMHIVCIARVTIANTEIFSAGGLSLKAFKDTDTRVNNYITGTQYENKAASFSDGRFIMVWESSHGDGSGHGIFAQLFAADGTTINSYFRVNSYTSSNQRTPYVAVLVNDYFVIAWDSLQDGSNEGIYAALYDESGNKQGNDFRVNTRTYHHQTDPVISALPDGFIIVWESYYQDNGATWGVYGQRYDLDGNTEGSEFRINAGTINHQESPAISSSDNGTFVVTWQDSRFSTSYIFFRIFEADGTAITSDISVDVSGSSSAQYEPSVEFLSDTTFMIVFRMTDDIYGKKYDISGAVIVNTFLINERTTSTQSQPAIGNLFNDYYVVTFISSTTIQGNEIKGRIFNSQGAVGEEFTVDTDISGNHQYTPNVCATSPNEFVVSWRASQAGGSGEDVWMRQFVLSYVTVVPTLQPTFFPTFMPTSAPNSRPHIGQSIGVQTAYIDSLFSFNIPTDAFVDKNKNDTLTITVSLPNGNGLPDWIIFVEESNQLLAWPTVQDLGALFVLITATDEDGSSVNEIFTIIVDYPSDKASSYLYIGNPFIPQTAYVGRLFTYAIPSNTFVNGRSNSNNNNGALTITVSLSNGYDLPDWITYDPATQTFRAWPTSYVSGSALFIKVTAENDYGDSLSSILTVVVETP